MSQLPPITDAYIDEIIKAPDAYNPTLNKTQGVKLRELLKLMRDQSEQQSAGNGVISATFQELTSSLFSGTLVPGAHYLLTDYKTTWKLSNGNIRRADNFEPIMLFALTSSKLSIEAYSAIYPQDKIFYLAGAVDYDGSIKPYSEEDWLYMNGLIPETGFIYRRIDSFTNRDINFDFRGFWIGDDNYRGNLYITNNVKIFSVGLDAQYNKQPKILGYSSVSNSTVNVGSGNTEPQVLMFLFQKPMMTLRLIFPIVLLEYWQSTELQMKSHSEIAILKEYILKMVCHLLIMSIIFKL